MKHTIKELGDCRIEITVDVDPTVWDSAQKKALNRALSNVQIKGFRKGKAPKAMAMASASSWPETVRLVERPKKSWL